MNTINITIQGDEPETVTLSLDEVQVCNLYVNNKAQVARIAELEKKLKTTEDSLKYASEAREEHKKEIDHANVLLTSLGVQEKDNHETDYYRKALPVSIRIALYIAKVTS
jgi:exonuclease III